MFKLDKSAIINNSGNTLSNSSLPKIIRISQFSKEWAEKLQYEEDYGQRFVTGSMGNEQFEFFIDCRHTPLSKDLEPTNIKAINEKLRSQKNPTILKDQLEDMFYILEMADYGRQSMSPRYRDFIPHIYYDGKKIPQRFIGMIKYYLTGSAYILIDKTCDIITSPVDTSKIKIIIYQKNNIENSFSRSLNLMKESDNKKMISKAYIDEDITEYTFIDNNGNNIITDLDAGFISELTVKNNGNIIEKQYENDSDKEYDDYFKASYLKDYLPIEDTDLNSDEEFLRKADDDYMIEYISMDIISAIKSKENNYDALYRKVIEVVEGDNRILKLSDTTLDTLKSDIGISNPEEIDLFTSDGKKLIYLKDYYYNERRYYFFFWRNSWGRN